MPENKVMQTPVVTTYDNFVLANEIEDQYNSHVDLSRFTTIDKTLVGTSGMKKIVNRYKATSGVEKLTRGQGNTKVIGVDYTPEEYTIALAQGTFSYYDEDVMTDPTTVQTGVNYLAVDLFNTTNSDIMTEWLKASLTHPATALDFAAYARAKAKLTLPESETERNKIEVFSFINPTQEAELAITLGENLKYVEAFARTGYVGTVAGVNIYTKADAPSDKIVVATKKAVKTFIKTGTEVEQDRDKDKRLNSVIARKYYVEALVDETQVCLIELTA